MNGIDDNPITLNQEPTKDSIISQEEIDKEAEDSKRDTLWGKPANDIINGRDVAAQYPPVRAIWEMVQNARDVNTDKCRIEFYRKSDCFIFRHDGLPFTNQTLDALILQTSSKVRDDIEQVGQYGTGFLTTHRLGRKFELSGSLQYKPNVECYCLFKDFPIDRTSNSKQEMIQSLAEQFINKEKLLKDSSLRSLSPSEWTTFKYLQPNLIEQQNAEECFEKSPELIPYVMCLNKGIRSISFIDEIEKKNSIFENMGMEKIADSELYTVYKTAISMSISTEDKVMSKNVISLDSKETITTKKGTVLPKVTVIVPIDGKKIVPLGEGVPRLFLYLPLIGTEKWGVNFIISSPVFTCATENRSNLRLVHDGQGDPNIVTLNQEAIKLASSIVFAYLNEHIAEWTDARLLAPVRFDIHSSNEELSDYYKSLKAMWISNLSVLSLVEVLSNDIIVKKTAAEIYVTDLELSKDINENLELLDAVYNLLCKMYPEAVPRKEHLVYWSEVFDKWYEIEPCNRIVSLDQIVDYVDINGLNVLTKKDLLTLCTYFKNSGKERYFDKNILLTEIGTLTNAKDGLKPIIPNKTLKECLKVLLCEKTSKFLDTQFSELASVSDFTIKDVKDALPSSIDILSERIKSLCESTKKQLINNHIDDSVIQNSLLTMEERNALMDYCYLIIPYDSKAFEASALNKVVSYFGYQLPTDDKIHIVSNELEWRGALRLLINDVLLDFTLLADTDKAKKTEWIHTFVSTVYGYSDFRSILKNYCCYLSQTGKYRYCEEMSKDMGIPDGMKNIYDTIVSDTNNNVSIRSQLFDKSYSGIADTEAKWEVIAFGAEIMKHIKASGKYYQDIDNYKHKDLIMDIINNFEDVDEGGIWKSAFEIIEKDIPQLLTKLVLDGNNRDPMIRIMKVKNTQRLKEIAEIIEDENLLTILQLGRQALQQKQNSEIDFEQKKKLGKYVEDYLRQELYHDLENLELKIEVYDEQWGQDIVIRIDGEAVYYIEAKSRWKSADSVMMSASQLDKSVEEKERYSLFAVNMIGFNSENVEKHTYPDTMEIFAQRIRVITNIGELNDEIRPLNRDPYEQVHIGGDYKAVIPQNLINNSEKSISYDVFMEKVLKPCIKEFIRKRKTN